MTTELLHVGNMSEQKNQLFLVDVMEELTKHNQNVHLTMIGSVSAYQEQVKERIAQTKLENYVSIMAPNTNVPEAMAAADLFVFPSTFEGFGIVLIEAQALGLKCLASDIVSKEANCGGIQYLPLEKGAAYWAEAINEEIKKGLGYDGEYDVSEFSVENMSGIIYHLYNGA